MARLRADLCDIYAAGWRVRTGLDLRGALPWSDSDDRPPDIVFIDRRLEWGLDDPAVDRGVVQFAADGTTLIQFGDVGRFLVTPDRVVFDPDVAADAPVIAPIVFGNVMAVSCWRRRQLPLHAAAVAVDGRAVILAGPARVGKSVLAAALVRRGHVLLADEVAVLSGGACLPMGGPLQLAEDALASAGVVAAGRPSYDTWDPPKYHWSGGAAPEPHPYPVAALFRLRKAEADAAVTPERPDEAAAIEAILHQTYWREMLDLLDSRGWASAEAEALLAAAPVWQLPVPRDLARVDELADLIERAVAVTA